MNSKEKNIFFSILTVTYNSNKTLEKTIHSVINQTYPNVEYIIVDGGSTDGTLDTINKYKDNITKWISEKDLGISDAMNKGIKMASGDVVGIIHADDWYEANAVEKVFEAFINTGADIVCGKVKFYKNEKPELIYESVPKLLEKEMTVQHPSVFIKKIIYENEGVFNLGYKYAMDYDLLLRLKLKGYKFTALMDVIANMRYEGKSDKNWFHTLAEARDVKIANGISAIVSWAYYIKQIVRMSVSRTLLYLKLDYFVNAYRKYFSIVKKENPNHSVLVNNIKILFISSRADTGGGPLQMFDIISSINRNKFIPWAALPCEEPFYRKIATAGVEILPIKKRAISLIDIFKLLKFIYLNDIQIIHSHGKGAGIYSRLLKLLCFRVKVIHTFHGLHYGRELSIKESILMFVEKHLARLTDKFINVSSGEQIQNAIIGILDFKKTVIINNYLPFEKIKQIEAACGNAKYRDEKHNRRLYFCAVARFDPIKQMPFLIESFIKSTLKLKLDARLILIGDGEEFEKCKKISASFNASEFVEFLGSIENAVEIMAKCDFYLISSLREAFSFSTAEAIAFGIPILASNVAGIAELVRPYEKGFLFKSNDYQSFEAGLLKMVENYNKIWIKANTVSNFADKYKEHKEYIQKYEKLYSETIIDK